MDPDCDRCGALAPPVWELTCTACAWVVALCARCTSESEATSLAAAHASRCACGGAPVRLRGEGIRIVVTPEVGGFARRVEWPARAA